MAPVLTPISNTNTRRRLMYIHLQLINHESFLLLVKCAFVTCCNLIITSHQGCVRLWTHILSPLPVYLCLLGKAERQARWKKHSELSLKNKAALKCFFRSSQGNSLYIWSVFGARERCTEPSSNKQPSLPSLTLSSHLLSEGEKRSSYLKPHRGMRAVGTAPTPCRTL